MKTNHFLFLSDWVIRPNLLISFTNSSGHQLNPYLVNVLRPLSSFKVAPVCLLEAVVGPIGVVEDELSGGAHFVGWICYKRRPVNH